MQGQKVFLNLENSLSHCAGQEASISTAQLGIETGDQEFIRKVTTRQLKTFPEGA